MGDKTLSKEAGSRTLNGNGSFEKSQLPDVHAIVDTRGVEIQRVGIDGVAYPMLLQRKNNGKIQVLGKFDMYGSLSPKLKGTNMSRFAELLLDQGEQAPISGHKFPALLKSLSKRLETDDVYVKAVFDFWVNKKTPISKRLSPMSYECAFVGQIFHGALKFVTEVNVPIATYCPCSKAMCVTDKEADVGKGAHAQRGMVRIQTITDPITPGLWLEDMIRIAELAGSAELYTLLKRPDEKYVTIEGYNNPKFVEDVARDVVASIQKLDEVVWAKVRVRNYESIHNHNATAYISQIKEDGVWKADSKAFY